MAPNGPGRTDTELPPDSAPKVPEYLDIDVSRPAANLYLALMPKGKEQKHIVVSRQVQLG